jgi:formate dehydrogenase maturation protein FdhE
LDNLKQNIVKNIAQELDCGFDCYYNSKTNEIIAIPNFSQFSDEEDFKEAFRDNLEKIKKHESDFIKFEALESFESFKIMERFVEQVTDKKLKTELENVLTNKKPFQNFKHRIDHSDFRQNWFEFKQSELEKIVENQLDSGKASAQHRV